MAPKYSGLRGEAIINRRGDGWQESAKARERQKELEGRFSSRSPGRLLIMTRLLPGRPQVSTANLKAQGQTERPGRAWKTDVSQGARGEEGCSTEDQHKRRKTWPHRFSPSMPAAPTAAAASARIRTRPENQEAKFGWAGQSSLCIFCNEMTHHIRSYLQMPPSTRSIQLLSNDWKSEPQLGRSSALNLNSYFNLSTPAVLSVPAEKEASTYCQHK